MNKTIKKNTLATHKRLHITVNIFNRDKNTAININMNRVKYVIIINIK